MKAILFLTAQKYLSEVCIFLSDSDKNKYGNDNKDLLNDRGFCENRCSEINTPLRGVNEFLFVLLTLTPVSLRCVIPVVCISNEREENVVEQHN